jgi:type 1 glutamine amidotransferase
VLADAPALGPATAAAAAPVALVVADARGFVHDSIPAAERAIVRAGRRDGVRVVVLARARNLTAARLRGAAAVVFVDTTGDPPLAAGGRERLLRFVRRGGGLVVLHGASNGFVRWPAWGPLIGARFVRHPPFGRGTVSVAGDVTTTGVPARFTVADEFYAFDRNPRGTGATVVARVAGGDRRPLAWRRAEGRGRVFHDALGHPDAAWADGDPRLALVRGGLRWAARVSRPAAR